ncbi:MAG TPA: hypothetical protein VGF79_08730 [Bacteroidia bacterium]
MQPTPININTKSSSDNLKNAAFIGIGVGALVLANKLMNEAGNETENKNEKKTEKVINDIKVDSSRLNSNTIVYRTAAETLYGELASHVLVIDTYSFEKMRSVLRTFNSDELRQVVKEFGTRPAKLFELIEVGAGGSFFEWCDAILNKEERETIRQIFVFTGLDKLPTEGLKYFWNYDDTGWFDDENKHRALANQWKPFRTSTPKMKVYPIKGNSQWINVLEKAGDKYISRSIKPIGYGAIGEYVAYDSKLVVNGIVENILVQVTDSRLGSWLGKTFVVSSREMNQSAPINNQTLYPI